MADRIADAFLVEWRLNGQHWVHAYVDEATARDQARKNWGSLVPVYRDAVGVLGTEQRTLAERTEAGIDGVAETEREACIAILEDLRPKNDRSEWTKNDHLRNGVLCSAVACIAARYER